MSFEIHDQAGSLFCNYTFCMTTLGGKRSLTN